MNPARIISKSRLAKAKRLMRALAASVEPFLRHTFGERYTPTLVGGWCVVTVVAMLSSAVGPASRVNLMPLVWLVLSVLLGAHVVSLCRRRRAGIHVESHSCGSSWGFWSELGFPAATRVLWEPVLCVGVAAGSVGADPVFAVWLFSAGLCLMVKSFMEERRAHKQVVDALDARVAGRALHVAVQRQVNLRPQGADNPVAVTAAAPALGAARPLAGMFGNLDPTLRELIREGGAGPRRERQEVPTGAPQAERIHVHPAGAAAAVMEVAPPAGRPRVVLVRTRPAPPPIHVAPAGSPRSSGGGAAAAAKQPQAAAVSASPHQGAPLPTPSEQDPDGTPERSSAGAGQTRGVAGKAPEEDERRALCRRIQSEAQELGFTIEGGGGSISPEVLVSKDELTLAVEAVAGTWTQRNLERVKRCIARHPFGVAVVSESAECLRLAAAAVHTDLRLEEAMTVGYFTPAEMSGELRRMAVMADAAPKSPTKGSRESLNTRESGAAAAPARIRERDI
jgi:hypothetical protein